MPQNLHRIRLKFPWKLFLFARVNWLSIININRFDINIKLRYTACCWESEVPSQLLHFSTLEIYIYIRLAFFAISHVTEFWSQVIIVAPPNISFVAKETKVYCVLSPLSISFYNWDSSCACPLHHNHDDQNNPYGPMDPTLGVHNQLPICYSRIYNS